MEGKWGDTVEGEEQKRPLLLSLGMLFKQCSGSYPFKRRDDAGIGTQNSAEEEAGKGMPRACAMRVHTRVEAVSHTSPSFLSTHHLQEERGEGLGFSEAPFAATSGPTSCFSNSYQG